MQLLIVEFSFGCFYISLVVRIPVLVGCAIVLFVCSHDDASQIQTCSDSSVFMSIKQFKDQSGSQLGVPLGSKP